MTIRLMYEKKEYTLEIPRKVAERLERNGFKVEDISDGKVLTTVPTLWAAAFATHHPTLKQAKIDAIYAAQNHKTELIAALVEMYQASALSLLDEPENEEENPTWTVDK